MANNTNTMTWEYDNFSRHYIVRGTRVLFPNFSGAAKQYNNEGRRNFHIAVPTELADEMRNLGIYVHQLDPRNEGDEPTYTLKISVYEDADIRLIDGKKMISMEIHNEPNKNLDDAPTIDKEFGKGRVMNGNVDIEFHISKNTKVPNSSPYLRVDMLILPIRKSKLAEAYESYMEMDDEDEDD